MTKVAPDIFHKIAERDAKEAIVTSRLVKRYQIITNSRVGLKLHSRYYARRIVARLNRRGGVEAYMSALMVRL